VRAGNKPILAAAVIVATAGGFGVLATFEIRIAQASARTDLALSEIMAQERTLRYPPALDAARQDLGQSEAGQSSGCWPVRAASPDGREGTRREPQADGAGRNNLQGTGPGPRRGNLDRAAVGQLGVDTAFDEQFVAGIDFA